MVGVQVWLGYSMFYPNETRFLSRDAVLVFNFENAEDTIEIADRLRFEFGVSGWLIVECSRYAIDNAEGMGGC